MPFFKKKYWIWNYPLEMSLNLHISKFKSDYEKNIKSTHIMSPSNLRSKNISC